MWRTQARWITYLFHCILWILLNNRLDSGNIIFRGGQNWSTQTGLIFNTRSTLFKIIYPSGNYSILKSILSVHCIQFRLYFWCAFTQHSANFAICSLLFSKVTLIFVHFSTSINYHVVFKQVYFHFGIQ